MELEVLKYIAAAIAFLPATGAALALGSIFSSYNEAVGRNPTAAPELNGKFFVAAGFAEAIALFGFALAFAIIFL